jgi:hypothetical protein
VPGAARGRGLGSAPVGAGTGWAHDGGGQCVDADIERAIGGGGAEGAGDNGRVGIESTGGGGVGLGA